MHIRIMMNKRREKNNIKKETQTNFILNEDMIIAVVIAI